MEDRQRSEDNTTRLWLRKKRTDNSERAACWMHLRFYIVANFNIDSWWNFWWSRVRLKLTYCGQPDSWICRNVHPSFHRLWYELLPALLHIWTICSEREGTKSIKWNGNLISRRIDNFGEFDGFLRVDILGSEGNFPKNLGWIAILFHTNMCITVTMLSVTSRTLGWIQKGDMFFSRSAAVILCSNHGIVFYNIFRLIANNYCAVLWKSLWRGYVSHWTDVYAGHHPPDHNHLN